MPAGEAFIVTESSPMPDLRRQPFPGVSAAWRVEVFHPGVIGPVFKMRLPTTACRAADEAPSCLPYGGHTRKNPDGLVHRDMPHRRNARIVP